MSKIYQYDVHIVPHPGMPGGFIVQAQGYTHDPHDERYGNEEPIEYGDDTEEIHGKAAAIKAGKSLARYAVDPASHYGAHWATVYFDGNEVASFGAKGH